MVVLAGTGGILIAEAVSQAVTARSVAYAALVDLYCFWGATRWRHVQGTKPNGRERMGRNPGGGTPTHTFTIYIRLY